MITIKTIVIIALLTSLIVFIAFLVKYRNNIVNLLKYIMPKKSLYKQILYLVDENKYNDAINVLKLNQYKEIDFDYGEMETYIVTSWRSFVLKKTKFQLGKITRTSDNGELKKCLKEIDRLNIEFPKISVPSLDGIIDLYNGKMADLYISELYRIDNIDDFLSHIVQFYEKEPEIFRTKVREINNAIGNLISKIIHSKRFGDGLRIIFELNNIELYKSKSILDEWRNQVINAIQLDINDLKTKIEIQSIISLFHDYKQFFTNKELIKFNSEIGHKHGELDVKGEELLSAFDEYYKNRDTENARKALNDIKSFFGDGDIYKNRFFYLTNLIESEERKRTYNGTKVKVEELIRDFKIDEATELIESLKSNPLFSKEDEDLLKRLITEAQEKLKYEKSLHGVQQLTIIEPFINVPKKVNEGEDADPLVIGDNTTCWGVLGVFDGMGGSGARKYTNVLSGKEHTAAYWASRIVRECVKNLVESRPLGENPEHFIEENLHEAIRECLNDEIKNFSGVSTIKSKMMRRLPTTMAMALYQLGKNVVKINCYWAGDSRIYLLTQNSIFFLTKDDANTDDPFAPENMDLAMNNTICQDDEFKINKSVIEVSLLDGPIVLIASTDGCFGYFKNPILFELMLRESIKKAKTWVEITSNIEKAIKDNIQQDDFSMSAVLFGDFSLQEISERMGSPRDTKLFDGFIQWHKSYINEENLLKSEIDKINEAISKLRSSDPSIQIQNLKKALQEVETTVGELIDKANLYGICLPSDESLTLLNPWKSKIRELEFLKNSIQKEIEKLNLALRDLKSKLDKFQEQGIIDNNKWYYNYRDSESTCYIKPTNQI